MRYFRGRCRRRADKGTHVIQFCRESGRNPCAPLTAGLTLGLYAGHLGGATEAGAGNCPED